MGYMGRRKQAIKGLDGPALCVLLRQCDSAVRRELAISATSAQ